MEIYKQNLLPTKYQPEWPQTWTLHPSPSSVSQLTKKQKQNFQNVNWGFCIQGLPYILATGWTLFFFFFHTVKFKRYLGRSFKENSAGACRLAGSWVFCKKFSFTDSRWPIFHSVKLGRFFKSVQARTHPVFFLRYSPSVSRGRC